MIPPTGRNEMTKTRNELIGKVDREVGARFDWGSAMGMDEMDDGEFIRFEDHELIVKKSMEDVKGYIDCFYQLAEIMGVGAQPCCPKEAWEAQMLPRLAHILDTYNKTVSVEVDQNER